MASFEKHRHFDACIEKGIPLDFQIGQGIIDKSWLIYGTLYIHADVESIYFHVTGSQTPALLRDFKRRRYISLRKGDANRDPSALKRRALFFPFSTSHAPRRIFLIFLAYARTTLARNSIFVARAHTRALVFARTEYIPEGSSHAARKQDSLPLHCHPLFFSSRRRRQTFPLPPLCANSRRRRIDLRSQACHPKTLDMPGHKFVATQICCLSARSGDGSVWYRAGVATM